MADSAECIFVANTGMAKISTSNTSRTGSGAMATIITGSSNGTLIKTIIVKAQTGSSQGMIRLFVTKAGGSATLLTEIHVPPSGKSGRDPSYTNVISLNYSLESGEQLSASTEVCDTFNVIAEAFDYSYSTSTTYIDSSVQYVSNSGVGVITTANTNLDGSGAMEQIFIASSDGSVINSIIIKAQAKTDGGMVRLFIQDAAATTPVLFWEVPIPLVELDGTSQSYMCQVILQGTLCISSGYSIWASTEVSNTFNIIVEGTNWSN